MRIAIVLLALVCLADAASAQYLPAAPHQPFYPGQYVQPGYSAPQPYFPPANCPPGGCPTVCPPGGCPSCPGCLPHQPIYLPAYRPRYAPGPCPGGWCPRR